MRSIDTIILPFTTPRETLIFISVGHTSVTPRMTYVLVPTLALLHLVLGGVTFIISRLNIAHVVNYFLDIL